MLPSCIQINEMAVHSNTFIQSDSQKKRLLGGLKAAKLPRLHCHTNERTFFTQSNKKKSNFKSNYVQTMVSGRGGWQHMCYAGCWSAPLFRFHLPDNVMPLPSTKVQFFSRFIEMASTYCICLAKSVGWVACPDHRTSWTPLLTAESTFC